MVYYPMLEREIAGRGIKKKIIKENPGKAAGQAYLREYVVNSFRKRGIEITLQDLVRQYQEICPDYAKQLALVLGLPESEDR